MSLAFRALGPKTFQKGKESKFGGEWDDQTLVIFNSSVWSLRLSK